MSNFITMNNLPFGLLADKMTSKHLTRHMVGIRIPVWDINYANINKDIYVQCSCVHDLSGKGLAAHLIETLESFGLDEAYQRGHLSGCAMDGQYVKLKIDEHLKNIFMKNCHLTWDPAHRIELSLKDSTKNEIKVNFIESTCNIIQNTMKYISYGHAYLELLGNKDLSETFLTPKIFKTMKFVGHSASIFTCFESDFESIIATLTKINNEESVGLLENILRVEFVLDFLFIKDIMSHLSKCSKDVQISCSLPWDFPNKINSLFRILSSMSKRRGCAQAVLHRNLFCH